MKYCIDFMSINENDIGIKGWAFSEKREVSFKVLDSENKPVDFEFFASNRRDVLDTHPDAYMHCGFTITVKNAASQTVFLNLEDGTNTEKIKINKSVIEANQKKGMFSMVNSTNMNKAMKYLKSKGLKKFIEKANETLKHKMNTMEYQTWRQYVAIPEKEIERQRSAWKELAFKNGKAPVFSIVIPTYNTDKEMLEILFDSIKDQTYPLFEVVISDGSTEGNTNVYEVTNKYAAEDERFKYAKVEKNLGISGNTNFGLEKATGGFIALCDHDDMLPPWALFSIAEAISNNPEAEFIYTDEDKIDIDGVTYFQPHFKSDFNPDLLSTNNYICHFSAFSSELQKKVGLFDSRFDGAQDFDYFLRCTSELTRDEEKKLEKYRKALKDTNDIHELAEKSGLLENSVKLLREGRFISEKIIHVPFVCYNWKCNVNSTSYNADSKPYASIAGGEAVKAYYDRIGTEYKDVDFNPSNMCMYETFFKDPTENSPLISVIIPNKDSISKLDACIGSLCKNSTYRNLEITIVENNSADKETFDYYDIINNNPGYFGAGEPLTIKVIKYEGEFNPALIMNFGATNASGEFLLFLHNDTELIAPDSINEMYNYAKRDNTGAVGAKLLFKDKTIMHAGIVLGHGGIAEEAYKGYKDNEFTYMNKLQCVQNFSAVSGACLMVRKDHFEQAGGFDVNFKNAYADIDFCLRLRSMGYVATYTPHAVFHHYETMRYGNSDKTNSLAKEEKILLERWKTVIRERDPYYNPNMSRRTGHFELKLFPEEK